MSLPDLKICPVSEELILKAAKTLYLKEDACACSSPGNGGLASASDLGKLPLIPFGAVGSRTPQQKRRRIKMTSDENLDIATAGNTAQMPATPQMPPQDTEDTSDDSNSKSASSADSTVNEKVVTRLLKLFEEAKPLGQERRDLKYMVSWLDPRHLEKLHKDQKMMANGLFYVIFDSKDKGTDFYNDLKNRGINNLKIDVL